MGNGDFGLEDRNPDCANNTWKNNFFDTNSPVACVQQRTNIILEFFRIIFGDQKIREFDKIVMVLSFCSLPW